MNRYKSRKLSAITRIIGLAVIILHIALSISCSKKHEQLSVRSAQERPLLTIVNPSVVVQKRKRCLLLFSEGELARTYRIGLGFNPEGHKIREGDGRTPEGVYYVCCKNPESRYYLSVGLSYPNNKDARQGFKDGVITRRQHDKITSAIAAKGTPPWNTLLGGEIFIHGHGSKSDWTLGCIALDNGDMQDLYDALSAGTPVTILP